MKLSESLKSLSVSAAVASVLAMGGCKNKETEAPNNDRIELVGVKNVILTSADTNSVQDGEMARYEYKTDQTAQTAANREFLANCVFALPTEALNGTPTENSRELCYRLDDLNRVNCVSVTLNKREDDLGYDGVFVHTPEGQTSIGTLNEYDLPLAAPTDEEKNRHIDLFAEEAAICLDLLKKSAGTPAQQPVEQPTQAEPVQDGQEGGEVEGKTTGSTSVEVKAGGKVESGANGKESKEGVVSI